MRIDVFRYRLPLAAPIALRHTTLTERNGFLVRLSENGIEGWGEAAPLEGFSRETEKETLGALLIVRDSAVVDEAGLVEFPSCVRFSLESALLDLRARRRGVTMAEALRPHPAPQLQLNALITSSGETAVADAIRCANEGFQTLKVKVGRNTLDQDIETIRAIRKSVPATITLRLDANQAWSFEEACAFAAGIDRKTIAFIEEPLADSLRLREFTDVTGMPVALDESLTGMTPEDLPDHAYARAIVLKPSIGGGLKWAARMAERARELGILPVVSNAFESGVGLRAHVALAAAFAPAPAGFGTYRQLADDVFSERLPLDGPLVDVEEILSPRSPEMRKLEAAL